MGDMGEDFKALREYRKANRAKNLAESTEYLNQLGIKYISKNNGVHLIVESETTAYDFYPSTGLFIDRATQRRGRGVSNLVKKLGI